MKVLNYGYYDRDSDCSENGIYACLPNDQSIHNMTEHLADEFGASTEDLMKLLEGEFITVRHSNGIYYSFIIGNLREF